MAAESLSRSHLPNYGSIQAPSEPPLSTIQKFKVFIGSSIWTVASIAGLILEKKYMGEASETLRIVAYSITGTSAIVSSTLALSILCNLPGCKESRANDYPTTII